MWADYKKLYTYLVGQIDDALEMMGDLDIMPLAPIRDKLKAALLAAEEMYLIEGEDE